MKSLQEAPMRIEEPVEDSRLLGCECNSCGAVSAAHRRYCENCSGADVRAVELATSGTLIAGSVVERPSSRWTGSPVYMLAYVETDDGAKVFGELVDANSLPPNGTALEFAPTVVSTPNDEKYVVPKWRPRQLTNGGK